MMLLYTNIIMFVPGSNALHHSLGTGMTIIKLSTWRKPPSLSSISWIDNIIKNKFLQTKLFLGTFYI